ncbi:hypothetical protein L226DRAFT_465413 [Lentinus tigrinus ALCF2SS1-7]|uniref:Uncharacterized protein n=1 Tax=Lentinus tigrinus ALCF2SS1-6 TaxID=1328759 RepID=A0A5C2S6E0_9APHY|nr:hypothetical protein L227DRAFT_503805 [Lentinus tigrinus ALCF2SS1-6]RPD73587.1 hypothetical protein L226DRAFT_465413 [Lentinus tigrinus ALCF2SS1-7]
MDAESPVQSASRKRKREEVEDSNEKAPRRKIRKLVPPRPFPTVPASVSATGPRSAHTEGKNYICITRRTELGAYLTRCKDVLIKDGYKSLHLSAMGAAIPHLMQLALSLPPILPFPQDEIHTEILTGTVEVQDEVIPDDEDEDISYRTRGKSTVSVTIKVGDGVDEPVAGPVRGSGRKNKLNHGASSGGQTNAKRKQGGQSGDKGSVQVTEQIVIREDELDDET